MIGLSSHPVPVPMSSPGVGQRRAGQRCPRLAAAGGPAGRHHVGVGPVLEQGQGEGVDKVEILGGAGVLYHVHQ